jgi:hypothetical protein
MGHLCQPEVGHSESSSIGKPCDDEIDGIDDLIEVAAVEGNSVWVTLSCSRLFADSLGQSYPIVVCRHSRNCTLTRSS